MTMKQFKRILCLLLSVLLVLHAIPTRVNAEDNNKFEIMFGGGNAELNGCILDSIVSISVPDEYDCHRIHPKLHETSQKAGQLRDPRLTEY